MAAQFVSKNVSYAVLIPELAVQVCIFYQKILTIVTCFRKVRKNFTCIKEPNPNYNITTRNQLR